MQNFLVIAMLLITPGMISLELRSILSSKKKESWSSYIKQLVFSTFFVFGLNLVMKALLGSGEQLFPLITPNPSTISLIKYMISSLVFAVLWAFIAEMIDAILKKRAHHHDQAK